MRGYIAKDTKYKRNYILLNMIVCHYCHLDMISCDVMEKLLIELIDCTLSLVII